MTEKRILLFGGSGQVGRSLQNIALPADWLLGAPGHAVCDFLRPGDIGRTIRDFGPDLVINAAAMTDIDACEQDPDTAMQINFEAVANIAAQCVERDAPFIHLSTDYVFDGTDGAIPYREDGPMNPINAYGHSKMMGEEAARHGSYWHVILRTSLIFSAYGDNVLAKTLRKIEAQEEITAVTDQIANPTSAAYLAHSLIRMANTVLSGKANCFGTFHLCNEPALSRYAFAEAIGQTYTELTAQPARLHGVTASELQNRVPRPGYSALNCEKILAIYGIEPRPWRDDLMEAVKHYLTETEIAGA